MLANRSIPRSTVIPELPYPDVSAAAKWLCDAFGFTVRLRIADHRIQLNVGDGAVVVIELPEGRTPGGSSTLVRVDDVNAHHKRAQEHGVRIIRPPADYPFGERQYSVVDFAGHSWTFSQSIADVNPKDWGGEPVAL
jgi:uncharacterized glyoxalase superfamily protein PhnB